MFIAAMVAAPTLARAGDPPTDAKFFSLRLGYDGAPPAERWSPLMVTIQPGEKSQSLLLTVIYEQDPTQRAVVSTPVTTTPGQQTTVPLLICPPQGVGRIDVTLRHNGSEIDRAAFARSPNSREMNLPSQLQTGGLVVGTLGVRILPAALVGWNDTNRRGYQMTGQDEAQLASLQTGDLTQTWAGMDGLNAVIVRQSTLDRLPAPTLEALATWVTGGGRLILIADSPGSTWRRFVPSGVYVGDFGPATSPPSLGAALAPGAALAKSINARPITVEPAGAARGWTSDKTLVNAAHPGSLIASGPFGGGITVVIGADPALLTAQLDDAALTPLWASLISLALPDHPTHKPDVAENYYNNYYSSSSGDGAVAAAALRSTVDALCDVPPVPHAVYTVIILLAVALAVAVSLGDFLILGRLRSRQRSWLSASCWIAACGALAWVLPNVIRGGDTSLGRAVVVDAIPAADPARPAVWRTGVTAVFAASSGALPIRPVAAPPQGASADLSGYWRGVSVLEVYRFDRNPSKPTVSELPLLQRVSALDGSAAAVTPPGSGLPIRQWTLRTLEDQSPGTAGSAPTARVIDGGEIGSYVVTGLPKDAVFTSGAVQTSRGWAPLAPDSKPVAKGSMRLNVSGSPSSSLSHWHQTPPPRPDGQSYYNAAYSERPIDGGRYLELDGVQRRTAAFDALAAAGEYAVVHVLVEAAPDITIAGEHRARGVYLYRIAVPLTESAPPSPSPALSSPQPSTLTAPPP